MKHPHNRERLEEYLKELIDGKHTLRQVATFTGYTREHLCRLKKRYKAEGSSCLINGHKGKAGPRAIPQAEKEKIISIYNSEFIINGKGVNFAYFHQALRELYGHSYSYRAIYDILSGAGISSPEKRRVKKKDKMHRPRHRKECEGEMLQIDASPYAWFQWAGNNERYSLHGAIDDATNKVVALFIAKNECSYGYYSILEQVFATYGLPQYIYSDRSSIFCLTPKEKAKLSIQEELQGLHEKRTQWQRILSDFGIGQILAWSPQAKGRIERLWKTLQGRLPYIFKQRGISTIEEANRFLAKTFIPAFNSTFALKVEKPRIWRKPPEDYTNALCSRFARKANGAGVISFMNRKFVVDATCGGQTVELCIFKDKIRASFKGKFRDVELLEESASPKVKNAPSGKDHSPEVLRDIIDRCMNTCAKEIS